MADARSNLDHICSHCRQLSDSLTDFPAAKRPKLSDSANEEQSIVPPIADVPCQQCLDLLDSTFQSKVMQAVEAKLESEKYVGLKSFQLCVQISPSVSMLHKIVTIWQQHDKLVTLVSDGSSSGSSLDNDYFSVIKGNIKRNFIQLLSVRLGLKPMVNSPFQILLDFRQAKVDEACKRLIGSNITRSKKKQKGHKSSQTLTISNVENAIECCTYEQLDKLGMLPSQTTYTHQCDTTVTFTHEPLFVAGRYNKYSRTLSQTPWILDGVRKAESSVQDLICEHLINVIRYDSVRFSSSGREDVDVRMLGSGRPFLLELVNPKVLTLTNKDYQQIQASINASTDAIQVHKLCTVSPDSSRILKDGEENKRKTYSALICCSQPVTEESIKFLDDIRDLTLSQRTPIRVLHRRSLAVRQRTIYSMKTTYINDKHFQLTLVTEAGTYIKEFVHGDFGRTKPNMCSLLGFDADIKALDVTDLELEWPPKT